MEATNKASDKRGTRANCLSDCYKTDRHSIFCMLSEFEEHIGMEIDDTFDFTSPEN
jgi:hypothetical protein